MRPLLQSESLRISVNPLSACAEIRAIAERVRVKQPRCLVKTRRVRRLLHSARLGDGPQMFAEPSQLLLELDLEKDSNRQGQRPLFITALCERGTFTVRVDGLHADTTRGKKSKEYMLLGLNVRDIWRGRL